MTSLSVASAGGRVLPIRVRYPADEPGTGAPPAAGAGPYPLIVFSQGYAIAPEAYHALLHAWAEAGFVVADPSYPHTTPGGPGGLDESDIVNHPADLRAVISRLLQLSAEPGNALTGLVDPAEVGVAGHSDGGDVSYAVAEGTCCRDPVVKAAVILSGAELASFGGTYGASPGIPVLVVQGSADAINPPACSEQLYDTAPGQRYYLDLVGAGHHVAYLPGWSDSYPPAQAAAYQTAVTNVSLLFWEAYLAHDPAAARRLEQTRELEGAGTLTVDQPVAVEGSCPGAPGG